MARGMEAAHNLANVATTLIDSLLNRIFALQNMYEQAKYKLKIYEDVEDFENAYQDIDVQRMNALLYGIEPMGQANDEE